MAADFSNFRTDIDLGFYDPSVRGLAGPAVDHFSRRAPDRGERMAYGEAMRAKLPHAALGAFARDPAVDPLALIAAQNATRVKALVPLRYGRMLASPFAFLRGGAAVMAADLAGGPSTAATVVVCGDMQLGNFGLFASAERKLIFAINDYDEVHPGPWEWDLKRLAASVAAAARHLGADEAEAVRAATASYREHVGRYAGMGALDAWYDEMDEETIYAALPDDVANRTRNMMGDARGKGHMRSFARLTEQTPDGLRLHVAGPAMRRETVTKDGRPLGPAVEAVLRGYYRSLPGHRRRLFSRYRIADVARKVVGIGGLGVDSWVVLMEGTGGDDPLFLQVKEAQASVLAGRVPVKATFSNQGRRVVSGQRMIQGTPDIFLSAGPDYGIRQYYIRQLCDMRDGVRLEAEEPTARDRLTAYAALCGRALALAHAKSGDAAVIAGYCGEGDGLDAALAGFAAAYADQTERDHATLEKARRDGAIEVETEG